MKTKVEPHSLDPAEEPLIWEGLTLNKCILVASIVALLSVSFQVLQGEMGTGSRHRVPQCQGGQTLPSSPPSFCPLFPPLVQHRHAPGTVSAAAGRSLQHLPSLVGSELGGHGRVGAGGLARQLIPLHPQRSPSPKRRPQKWRLPSPSSLKAAWRITTATMTVMMTTATMLTVTWYGAEARATASRGGMLLRCGGAPVGGLRRGPRHKGWAV